MNKRMFVLMTIGAIAAIVVSSALVNVQKVSAQEVRTEGAREFSPGEVREFDPQPEPPGRDASARDFAPGTSEIGDPHVRDIAPGTLHGLTKPGE